MYAIRSYYETLMRASPRWSDVARAHGHDHLGIWALNRREFGIAAGHFEAAIAVAPNPRYFHQLGLANLYEGQLARARAAFERSAHLTPTVADPWLGLARVHLAAGDATGALAAVRNNFV